MGCVDYAVKDCVGDRRVTDHIIPVGGGILRGYDDGFPLMPVLYYFEQYGPFLGIKRYKAEVVKDE